VSKILLIAQFEPTNLTLTSLSKGLNSSGTNLISSAYLIL